MPARLWRGTLLKKDYFSFPIPFKHLEQTFTDLPPIFLLCRLIWNFLRVAIMEWLLWFPVAAPRLQMEHTLGII
jgi:hypothetical protein